MPEKNLQRIENALELARQTVQQFTPGRIEAELKSGGDPVTAADIELDRVLKNALLKEDEGWLSEETADDLSRLQKRRVWVVDPLDGTREFVQGISEWCISICLVEDGKPVAAGICNPAADEIFLGSVESGVTLNGKKVTVTDRSDLAGAVVLASRTEVSRGRWKNFENAPFSFVPMGSVAYKLARVAAGLADATFTLVPKNEWDIAAGCLLVEAAGGKVIEKNGAPLEFNRKKTLVSGLIASASGIFEALTKMLL